MCGMWCVVYGVWCMVCGMWCVVCGVWNDIKYYLEKIDVVYFFCAALVGVDLQ